MFSVYCNRKGLSLGIGRNTFHGEEMPAYRLAVFVGFPALWVWWNSRKLIGVGDGYR